MVIFNVKAHHGAGHSANLFKKKGQVGAKRLNDGACEDSDSKENGVDFGDEDEVEDNRESTDVDNFETVVEKIFGIRASDPVFFLDGEDIDHDVFNVDEL